MGITICLYLIDLFYCMHFMTFKIETSSFHRLEKGVQLSFEVTQCGADSSGGGGCDGGRARTHKAFLLTTLAGGSPRAPSVCARVCGATELPQNARAHLRTSNWVSYCVFARVTPPLFAGRFRPRRFENPSGFRADRTGYIYVNVPWVESSQWHAFSLYPHPTKPNASSVCISVGGDWTGTLHSKVQYDTTRPCFVSGPFTSPYSTATDFDNLILVASGIGITPAVSLIQSQKESRRVNLIWMCRDASLLEFMLGCVEFDDDAFTIIYYTGKRKLSLDVSLPPNVLIFNSRPDLPLVRVPAHRPVAPRSVELVAVVVPHACSLVARGEWCRSPCHHEAGVCRMYMVVTTTGPPPRQVLRGLIHGIETGTGLPEDVVEESKALQE